MTAAAATTAVAAIGTTDGVAVGGVFDDGCFAVDETDFDDRTGGGNPAVVGHVTGFASAFGGDGAGIEEGGDPIEDVAFGIEDIDVDSAGEDGAHTGAAADIADDGHHTVIKLDFGCEEADLLVLEYLNLHTLGRGRNAGVSILGSVG